MSYVSAGSPSRGGEVVVCVFDINQPSLPTPFLFCSCVCFCLYGPFTCISFHKFSRQLSAFSLCSFGSISPLLVLPTITSLYESLLQPWYNPWWLTGLKAPTNELTNSRVLFFDSTAWPIALTPFSTRPSSVFQLSPKCPLKKRGTREVAQPLLNDNTFTGRQVLW